MKDKIKAQIALAVVGVVMLFSFLVAVMPRNLVAATKKATAVKSVAQNAIVSTEKKVAPESSTTGKTDGVTTVKAEEIKGDVSEAKTPKEPEVSLQNLSSSSVNIEFRQELDELKHVVKSLQSRGDNLDVLTGKLQNQSTTQATVTKQMTGFVGDLQTDVSKLSQYQQVLGNSLQTLGKLELGFNALLKKQQDKNPKISMQELRQDVITGVSFKTPQAPSEVRAGTKMAPQSLVVYGAMEKSLSIGVMFETKKSGDKVMWLVLKSSAPLGIRTTKELKILNPGLDRRSSLRSLKAYTLVENPENVLKKNYVMLRLAPKKSAKLTPFGVNGNPVLVKHYVDDQAKEKVIDQITIHFQPS